MSDLIDRQAAIDALDTGFWGVKWDKALATAMLKDLPSAQPTYTDEEIQKMQDLEQAQIEKAYQLGYEEGKRDAQERKRGKWIPCSERLPEEGHEVLVCLTDWQTGDQKRVVSYRIDFNMWHGYGRYNEKCVAWMPLPEAWEGEQP